MNYKKIYERLYRLGYHSKLKNHGKRYIEYLCHKFDFKTVLDVGCSNGVAVKELKRRRKIAYGIDVADIAIRYAGSKSYVENCVVASTTDIPFKDNFFDAVFSCDMLEHLTEKDVGKAITELLRVSKKYLFLVIDGEFERNREWLKKAKEFFPADFQHFDNLHLTVWPLSKWKKQFIKRGCKFINHYDPQSPESHDLFIFEVPK